MNTNDASIAKAIHYRGRAQRTEVSRDEWGNLFVKVDGLDVAVNYSYGRVYLIDHEEKRLDANTAEDFDRLAIGFKALADFKRLESQVRE